MALMLATSCVLGLQVNKVPVNIGFKPVIGHDTRAQIEESVPFPQDRSFKVWATNMDNGATVLDNETISCSGGQWLASQTWPESELMFTAYWPTDLAVSYDPGKGVAIKGFNTDEDPRDLLVARNRDEFDADSLVTLNFDHLLSRVNFRILQALESNIDVKVKKITLTGYGFEGDYNDGKWTVASGNDSRVVYDAGEGEATQVTKDAAYIGDDFLVVPQLCIGNIEVEFMIRVGTGGWITEVLDVNGIKTDWQSGRQYTYTLTLTDQRLVYTTGISSWNNRE